MMIAAILKETTLGENRVAATPKTVKELIKSGLTVRIQSEAGEASFYSNQDYKILTFYEFHLLYLKLNLHILN